MIPILFKEDETNFNSNGIGHLTETVTYDVREVRNGEFELFLEYPVTGRWFNEIKDFRFILAEPNEVDDDHIFRIYETVKDAEAQSILVYATTKSNDLGGNLVNNVIIDNETAQQAMNRMKSALIMASDYDFISDIQTRSSTQWIRRNPLNCIAGEEGSLVNYWGGEIKRTNTTIYLYSRRGKDRVTTIRPGKSLDGFKITSSTKGMITRILPFFTYTPEGSEDPVTITGSIVDSPLVNNYPVKYITPVDFSSDRDITTLEQLNSAAGTYFATMNPDCDKPSVKLDVDLIQLSDSSEYEKFKALERIQLTDTVIVWVKKYNVDVEVKVTEITYNGMLQQVTNIVAGTKATDLYSDVKKSYTQGITELQKYVNGMENGIRNTIQISADGKNRIFRGYTEPDIGISKLNDLWYKELGSGEVEMWIFDGAYWQPLVTAGLNEAVKAEVEAMIAQADADRLVIEATQAQADKAIEDAGFSLVDSAKAKSDAISALSVANTAKTDASTAIADANTAKTNASTALSKATTAITDSGTAIANAASALSRVGAVEVTTGGLTTSYDALTNTVGLKADQTVVDGINSKVTTQGTAISANATAISLKANSTTVDTLAGTVTSQGTSITANADAIKLKAESSLVNTIKGTVDTHTTQIKVASDGLALKADSSRVDTINGTVDTHTTQISANSTAINARLTSAQVETLLTGKKYVNETTLNATAGGLSASITQVSNDLGETDTKVTSIEATVNGINTVVGNKADKSQITQLAGQVATKVESATYSSKMTQLDSSINLRLEKNKVISQINLSTEGILLQGKRIQLDGDVTMTAAFINSIKAIDISADRIVTGTLNAANVNLINLNVSKLVGNTSEFVKSAWNNSVGGGVTIDGSGILSISGSLSTRLTSGSLTTASGTKSGTVNALGIQITDSSNGQTTQLDSDGLQFTWYGIVRRMNQTSEGLEIKPITGSGARLNSALALITGPGADKVAYIQLANPDGGTNARLQMEGKQLSLRHPNGGSLDIADFDYNGQFGQINSGRFRTTTTDGRGIQMVESQISAFSGNQTIYILPTGNGELRIGSGGPTPNLWPVRAQSFVQGSSRKYKTNIKDYTAGALSLLYSIKVVEYDLIRDVESGIINKQVGFISEDSHSISSLDENGIDIYRTIAVSVKGIQQLSEITYRHETKITEQDIKIANLEKIITKLKEEEQNE